MLLTEKVKWYCVTSALLFIALTVYLERIYTFSDFNNLELDRILGYIRFTAGASTLIFGVLIAFRSRLLNCEIPWYGVFAPIMFIVLSTYMQLVGVFPVPRIGTVLYLCELSLALLTLIVGLLSFPRLQAFVCFVVWLYSFYRFSQPPPGM